jgi:hypothetical protein
MQKLFHLRTACAALVSLGLALWSQPVLAAGSTEINYTSDGKATATACLAHLAGKPLTTAINQAGFETLKNTRKFTSYQKRSGGGLMPRRVILVLRKKHEQPGRRICAFALTLPGQVMTETSSPDFHDFSKAMRAVFKSGGYKFSGTATTGLGAERIVWTGPTGSYTISVSGQYGSVTMEFIPE